MAEPKWKRFEKVIHQLHEQLASPQTVVTYDDKIIGWESRTERQLDVTIKTVVGAYRLLIVIECKDRASPIDVGEIGEFTALARDVKANKAVMISSSGYTPAAISMAKANGIDTRTYLDTESVDWRSVVSIPVLLHQIKIDAWMVRFSSVPGFRAGSPTNTPFPLIETFSEDREPLGPIVLLLAKRWNHEESLHVPGELQITLAEHAIVYSGPMEFHVKLVAICNVGEYFYLGPLGIKMQGFRDEQDGSLWTKELTTDFIDPAGIERGEVAGWDRVPNIEGLAVEVSLSMGYVSVLPEAPEEIEAFRSIVGSH